MNLKKILTKKIGPLPAFAYPLIAVGGYIAWKKIGGGAGTNLGNQLPGSTGYAYDAMGNLVDSYGNIVVPANPGPNDSAGGSSPTIPVTDSGPATVPVTPTYDYQAAIDSAYFAGVGAGSSLVPSGAIGNTYSGIASPSVAAEAKPVVSVSPLTTQAPVPAPTPVKSNIVSVQKLLNGATLTTLVSGRQIEQVPGKTPYVVKEGARATFVPPVHYENAASVTKLKSGAILTTLKSGRVIEQAPGKSPYVVKKEKPKR